jgi:hypothetical protein
LGSGPPTAFTPIINGISNGFNIGAANIKIASVPFVPNTTGAVVNIPLNSTINLTGGPGVNPALKPGVGIGITGRW